MRILHSVFTILVLPSTTTSSWSTAQLLLSNASCTACTCTPLAARRAVGPSRASLTGATLHESPQAQPHTPHGLRTVQVRCRCDEARRRPRPRPTGAHFPQAIPPPTPPLPCHLSRHPRHYCHYLVLAGRAHRWRASRRTSGTPAAPRPRLHCTGRGGASASQRWGGRA